MHSRKWYHPKRIALLVATLLIGYSAAAQKLTGSLTGTVRDSVSQLPVAYATVVLLTDNSVGKSVAVAVTDENGLFSLTNLAAGRFRLQVSFVGYAPITQVVGVTAAKPTNLGLIFLSPAAQRLGEAVVAGTKSLVEVHPDRFVYNAQQDVGNVGGTAVDVLRKTPLLAVDGEGNVTMRGSANFKVLVDDKPSPLLAQNLAQALKGIPADQVQRVEVITSPSAKYDGEGTAGIINIVLKKGGRRNVNGRLGASGGNRSTEVTSALSLKKGKLGINGSASAGRWNEPDQLMRRRLGFTSLGTDTLTQSGRRQTSGGWYLTTLGLDYDPAAQHSFSLSGTLNGYRAQGKRDLFNRFVSPDFSLNQLFTRATTEFSSSLSTEVTSTYTRTFAQPRREWSVLGQYARTAGRFGYEVDQYLNSAVARELEQADYREYSRGRTPSRETTVQSDFTQPFGEKKTLQLGLKAIFRRTGSLATVEGLTPDQSPDFENLPDRATDFRYAQNVQAAYASYTAVPSKKLTVSLGSRVERTDLTADFRASNTEFSREYRTLLPSGSLQYAFNDTSGLRLAYGRRITRPFIDYLNPFVDLSNSQNITYGNPELDPELTDAYEVSYNTAVHKAQVVLSGSIRHTGNAIEQVRLPTTTAGVSAQTFANVAANTAYQLTLYGAATLSPHWQVSGGPDGQYLVFRSSEQGINRQGFTSGMSLNTSYTLPKKTKVQASFAGSLPAPTLQGRGAANLYYAVGMKKALLHDQAELVLNVVNPFHNSISYRSNTATGFLVERTEYRAYQRAIRVSFSYRFGQEIPERQRKQISNDDRKSK